MYIWQNNRWANPCPRFLKKMCSSYVMMDFQVLVPILNEKKCNTGQYLKNWKRNQKSRAPFFTTLHSNKLKSKITEKFHRLMELKLKVSVIKCTKRDAYFTSLDKMPKLWFINQLIVLSFYLYREIKKKL